MTEPKMNGKEGAGRLLDAFPVPSLEEWQAEVVRLLKGASLEKSMFTRTIDGIKVRPIYTAADTAALENRLAPPGRFPFLRGADAPGEPAIRWEVAQELPFPDPADFNRCLRHDLERGQTSVNLVMGRGGTAITTLDDIDQALEGVDLEQTPLLVRTGPDSMVFGAMLAALCQRRGIDPINLSGVAGCDPLAELVSLGQLPMSLHRAWDGQSRLCRWAEKSAPGLRTIAVDGSVWGDAGAGAVQELAFSMAGAVQALREAENRGIDTPLAAVRCYFIFSVGTDFFTEIAKFRAARLLWARIVDACGVSGSGVKLVFHARSSGWSSTLFDPHTNILRATTQAFAAIAGGCRSLHLAPFDQRYGLPGDLSRRLARNTQLILRDEAHFDRVIDPGGGSWYVESLTAELARLSWEQFQEIETGGGMTRAIRDGRPQALVADTVRQRRENLSLRCDVLVGTTRYPDPGEPPLEGRRRQRKEAAGGDPAAPKVDVVPLPPLHGGEPFEDLRLRVGTEHPPRILLAAMGPPAGYMTRLEFVRSLYQVGGFDVVGGQGFGSVAEVVAALGEHHPAAACIVSRDDRYPDLVPELAAGLLAADPDLVLHLAGGPALDEEQLKTSGIRQRITLRSDVHQLLSQLAQQVGVPS